MDPGIANTDDRLPLRLRVSAAIKLGRAESERLKSDDAMGFYASTVRSGRLLELQMIEGSKAHFASGEWRRIWEGAYRGWFGVSAYSTKRWEGDGISVEVHVNGDYAIVSIGASSTESGEDRDTILRQKTAEQTVRIPLGKWTDLSVAGAVVRDDRARRIATDSRDVNISLVRMDVLTDN